MNRVQKLLLIELLIWCPKRILILRMIKNRLKYPKFFKFYRYGNHFNRQVIDIELK